VTVTKAKGSQDGTSLAFKLNFVSLGQDADGDAFGSCNVEYLNTVPMTSSKLRPKGANQIIFMDVLKTMAPTGATDLEEIVEAALSKKGKGITDGQTKDDRRNMRRTFDELVSKKLVFAHGENRVSLTSLITGSGDAGF
jgi:hypothetical protein